MEQPLGTINGTQAFIIECNRANSDIDANTPNDQNAKWTTKTDFQLKRGDRVSVEAIMIESIGASNAGQTIEFDAELVKEGSNFQPYVDNKVVFEFGFYINNNGQKSVQLPISLPNAFMAKDFDCPNAASRHLLNYPDGFHRANTLPVNSGGYTWQSNTGVGGYADIDTDPLENPCQGSGSIIIGNTTDVASNSNIPNAEYNGGGYGEQQFPAQGKGFGGGRPGNITGQTINGTTTGGDSVNNGSSKGQRTNHYSVYGFIVNGIGRGTTADQTYFLTGNQLPGDTIAQIGDKCIHGDVAGAGIADQVLGIVLATTRVEGCGQGYNDTIAGNGVISANYRGITCNFDKPITPLIAYQYLGERATEKWGQGRDLEGMNCELVPGMCVCVGSCRRTTGVGVAAGSEVGDYTQEALFPLVWENFGQIEDIVHFTDTQPHPADIMPPTPTQAPGSGAPPPVPATYGDQNGVVTRLLIKLAEPHTVQRQPSAPFQPTDTAGANMLWTYVRNTAGAYQPRMTPVGALPNTTGGGERTYVIGIPKYGSNTSATQNGRALELLTLQANSQTSLYSQGSSISITNGCSLVNSLNPTGSDIQCKGRLGIGLTNAGAYQYPSGLYTGYTNYAAAIGEPRWGYCPSFHRRLGGGLLWEMTRTWCQLDDLIPVWNNLTAANAQWRIKTQCGLNDAPQLGIGISNRFIQPSAIVGEIGARGEFWQRPDGYNQGGIYPSFHNNQQDMTGLAGVSAGDKFCIHPNWGSVALSHSGEDDPLKRICSLNLRDYKDNCPYIIVRPTYQGCQAIASGAELAPKLEAMTAFVVVEATESFEDVNELAAKFVDAFHSVNQLVNPTRAEIEEKGIKRKNNVTPYYSTGYFPASWGWVSQHVADYTQWSTNPPALLDGFTNGNVACWNKIAPVFAGNLVKVIPANLFVGIDWEKQENSPYYYSPHDEHDYLKTGGGDLTSNEIFWDSFAAIAPVNEREITAGSINIYNKKIKTYAEQVDDFGLPSNRGMMWNNQIYGNLAYKDFRKAWAGDRFNRLDCCRMNYYGALCQGNKPNNTGTGYNQNGCRYVFNGTPTQSTLPRLLNDIPRPVILNHQLKKKKVFKQDAWLNTPGVSIQPLAPPFPSNVIGDGDNTKKFRGTILRKNDVIMTNLYWTEENLDALQEIMRHNEEYNNNSVADEFGATDAADGYETQNKQNTNWYYLFDIGQTDDSSIACNNFNGIEAGNREITMLDVANTNPTYTAKGNLLETIQNRWQTSYYNQTPAAFVAPNVAPNNGIDAASTNLPPVLGVSPTLAIAGAGFKAKPYGSPYTAIPYGLAQQGLNYGTGLFCYVGETNCPTQAQPYPVGLTDTDQTPIDYNPEANINNATRWRGWDSNVWSSISPAQSWLGQGYGVDYCSAPETGRIRVCSRWNDLWDDYPPFLNLEQPDRYVDGTPYYSGWDCGEPVPDGDLFPQFTHTYPAGVIWNGQIGDDLDWAGCVVGEEVAFMGRKNGIDLGSGYIERETFAVPNYKPLNEHMPNLKELLKMAKDRNIGCVPYYYAGLDNIGATCVLQPDKPAANDSVGDLRTTDRLQPGGIGFNATNIDLTHPTSNKTLEWAMRGDAKASDNRPIFIGFVTHRAYEPTDNPETWELGDIHWGDLFGWSTSFMDNPAIVPMNTDDIGKTTDIAIEEDHAGVPPGTIHIIKPPKPYCWNNMNYIWVGANNANMIYNNEKMRFELSQLYTQQTLSNFNSPQPIVSGTTTLPTATDLPDAGEGVVILNTDLNDAYMRQVSYKAINGVGSNVYGTARVPPVFVGSQTGLLPNKPTSSFQPTNKGVQDAQSGVFLKDIWLCGKNWQPPPSIDLQNYYDPSLKKKATRESVPQEELLVLGHSSDQPYEWIDGTEANWQEITANLTKATDTMWRGCLLDKMGFDYRQLIPRYGSQSNRFKQTTYSSDQTDLMNKGVKPLIMNSNADTSLDPTLNLVGTLPQYYSNGAAVPITGATAITWQEGTPFYSLGFLNNQEVNLGNVTSSVLTANRIATLFACPFYVVLSDIAPTQFQSGQFKQECMFYGLKNYGAGQYFYVFGSNYSQLVDTDRHISQIKTEIRNPLTGHLAKLSPNSCILYKIERNISLPPINYDVDGDWVGEELPPKGLAHLPSVGLHSGGGGGGHLSRVGGAEGGRGETGRDHNSIAPQNENTNAAALRALNIAEAMAEFEGVPFADAIVYDEMEYMNMVGAKDYLKGDDDAMSVHTGYARTEAEEETELLQHRNRRRARNKVMDDERSEAAELEHGSPAEKAIIMARRHHKQEQARRFHNETLRRRLRMGGEWDGREMRERARAGREGERRGAREGRSRTKQSRRASRSRSRTTRGGGGGGGGGGDEEHDETKH